MEYTFLILTYSGLLLFLIYNAIILFPLKLQPLSLSETYYLLENKYKQGRWFTLMMILLVFTLSPVLMEYTSEHFKFLAFFILLGILFTGAAPLFKTKSQSPIHYIGAGTSAVASILWTIFCFPTTNLLILGSGLSIIGVALLYRQTWKKYLVYQIEFLLFCNIFILLLISIYSTYGNL